MNLACLGSSDIRKQAQPAPRLFGFSALLRGPPGQGSVSCPPVPAASLCCVCCAPPLLTFTTTSLLLVSSTGALHDGCQQHQRHLHPARLAEGTLLAGSLSPEPAARAPIRRSTPTCPLPDGTLPAWGGQWSLAAPSTSPQIGSKCPLQQAGVRGLVRDGKIDVPTGIIISLRQPAAPDALWSKPERSCTRTPIHKPRRELGSAPRHWKAGACGQAPGLGGSCISASNPTTLGIRFGIQGAKGTTPI